MSCHQLRLPPSFVPSCSTAPPNWMAWIMAEVASATPTFEGDQLGFWPAKCRLFIRGFWILKNHVSGRITISPKPELKGFLGRFPYSNPQCLRWPRRVGRYNLPKQCFSMVHHWVSEAINSQSPSNSYLCAWCCSHLYGRKVQHTASLQLIRELLLKLALVSTCFNPEIKK